MARDLITKKSLAELEMMRQAGSIVGQALALMASMVAPGIKTAQLDQEAEAFIRSKGAYPTFKGYGGFPTAVCISVNEQVVHGFPSGRKLKEGDIVSLDCGATFQGLVADAAITVPVGEVAPEIVQLLQLTRRGLEAGIAQAWPGNRLGDISHAIEAVAKTANLGVVREYCGHGVGHRLHEAPQIPNFGPAGVGPVLEEGFALAIEPMFNLGTHQVAVKADGWTVVTLDGKASAHFEHTVAITREGPRILTLP